MKCTRCGKENVDPVYPHTCTPLALVLAEKIERANAGVYSQALYEEYTAAARELRRLQAENEALQQALRTEEAISFRRQLHEVQAENEVLREALSHISTTVNMHSQELHIARAALARAGEKK
jgi:hypothetical protein